MMASFNDAWGSAMSAAYERVAKRVRVIAIEFDIDR
jgi:hypothetical protein